MTGLKDKSRKEKDKGYGKKTLVCLREPNISRYWRKFMCKIHPRVYEDILVIDAVREVCLDYGCFVVDALFLLFTLV